MAATRKKATRLSQDQLIKLGDYLRANKEDLETKTHTCSNIAKSASALLGFPISTNSISRVAAMVSVTIKTINNGGTEHKRIRIRQIAILRNAIINLYEKCGEELPRDLTDEHWPFKPHING